jgi:hypothetical protein
MDKTLAHKKMGDQTSLNSIKESKNNFIIILKIMIFGAEAKSKVTLTIEPS